MNRLTATIVASAHGLGNPRDTAQGPVLDMQHDVLITVCRGLGPIRQGTERPFGVRSADRENNHKAPASDPRLFDHPCIMRITTP
jgi:hypothetical protein